jgi:hypothetical protein
MRLVAIKGGRKRNGATMSNVLALLPQAARACRALAQHHQARSRGDDHAEQMDEKWRSLANEIERTQVVHAIEMNRLYAQGALLQEVYEWMTGVWLPSADTEFYEKRATLEKRIRVSLGIEI